VQAVAQPGVVLDDRQPARVLVGQRVAYLNTTATETSSTQSVEFLDTGVQLYFRPFVSNNNEIRMELKPQVSDAKPRNVGAAGGGKATVPDEITQELRTNVRVKSGQTIVLGGLFREESETTNRQIPGLGDLLPGAFSGASAKMKKQEIIFLITPTVVEDAQDYRAGDKALQVAEATRVGARADLLPFSQTHLIGTYQVQALDAWKQGDRATAMYYVDQALRMEPNSPMMISLREAIRTDDKDRYRIQFDSLMLLTPEIRSDRGWAGVPDEKQLAHDPPTPIDDDFHPTDPLPLPDPEAPRLPGERAPTRQNDPNPPQEPTP